MLKIKICGLCNSSNLREIIKADPDFVGFIFYPASKRYAGEEIVKNLIHIVPGHIMKTGVFVNEKTGTILKYARYLTLDAIQLHGSESPDDCERIKAEGLITIKAFGIGNSFDNVRLMAYLDSCDYFLFDTGTPHYGGSGKRFDWKLLEEYKLDKEYFLSGGIGYEDIEVLRSIRCDTFFGVDINSRFESSPGIKDAEKIKTFIEEIKS